MKRFYKDAAVQRTTHGFAIALDGRAVKTPKGAPLALHNSALAEAIAAEWAGQGEELGDMPLTRLANTAIDRVRHDRGPALKQMIDFGRHDVVCYRAAAPADLVAREAAAWDAPLAWARAHYAIDLATTTGIASIEQPGFSPERLQHDMVALDEFALTGLSAMVPILKSLVLALSLADGRLDADAAHAAAHVNELFQAEKWGRDAEAEARLAALLAELQTANRFHQLAKRRA
jgi:chaperone required for assembly of F1-ATPase